MAANGSHGNRYTLRDKLENVERGDIGGSSKLTDGYGNVSTRKFWQNVEQDFDTNSDLYKHHDYGGGTWSYLSDNESSRQYSPTTTTVSRASRRRCSVCSDASTGEKEPRCQAPCTATVPPRRLTASHTPERLSLVLYSFSDGRTRTLDTHLSVTVNTNMMYEGRLKYLDAGYLQEHDAVFDVEAGDVMATHRRALLRGLLCDRNRRAQGCSRHV